MNIPSTNHQRSSFIANGVLFAVALALGPVLALWHLHGRWNPNGDYAYGWVVPFLAAFLFKARWDARPAPSAPVNGAAGLALVCAALMLPARWLQEAAPERTFCAWSCAVSAIGASLFLISKAGGVSWFKWFSFPFAFLLTAVPWPHTLEMLVSNFLMRGTAGVTVEILCLFGIPGSQSGNLVHIETGVIDIDEACSGIRSLQAMVMLSLFLGELFRLKPARRVLLLVLGIAATLLANVIRTVTLSSIGFNHGMAAVDRYHDSAGFAVLALSLSGALLAAYLLHPAAAPASHVSNPPVPRPVLPLKLCGALLVLFVATDLAVEGWYRLHEQEKRDWNWSVQWPRQCESFRFIEIPKRSLQILMCDESRAATWKEPDGTEWSLYWIRWNPGNPAAESAKVHRPDVCLNAEGAIMEKDTGTRSNAIGGIQVPFHGYVFRMAEKQLHVFFCLDEQQAGNRVAEPLPQFEGVDMLRRALTGRRRSGLQSLELAVTGYHSVPQAQEAFNARITQLIEPGLRTPQ